MNTAWELDRNSPLPLYLQIRQRLLVEISDWPDPERRFYSDDELADRFGVSKMTVRQGMTQLVNEGVLTRKRAQGTFISRKVFEERLSPQLDIGAQYESAGYPQEVRLLAFRYEAPTEVDLEAFGGTAGQGRMLSLNRLRMVSGIPVAIDRRRIPEAIGRQSGIDREAAKGSIIQCLRALPDPPVTADWTIMMREATADEAEYLWVPRGSPLLVRRMAYRTAEGKVILTGETMHGGENARYQVTLSLDGGHMQGHEG